MLVLSLESATETIDLNALLGSTAAGVQAIKGLTGLGLPPVEVRWSQGAGDGAKYRGRRVLPRDLDLPLDFRGLNRAGLRLLVAKLSRVLSGEATLRLTDGAEQWITKVVRVGGGDVVYGEDTDGEGDLDLTITVRAGDPYWTKVTPISIQQTGASIGPTISLTNNGTADAYPVWEIEGPGVDFTITSPRGETLVYSDFVDIGKKIFIDTAAGTVVDGLGVNRYTGLAPAPKFFPLRPGANAVTVSFDRSSAKYLAAAGVGVVRTNRIINPRLQSASTGWTLDPSITYDATNKRLKILGTTLYDEGRLNVTGLVIGKTYQLNVWTGVTVETNPGSPLTLQVYLSSPPTDLVSKVMVGVTAIFSGVSETFVATATTATLVVRMTNRNSNLDAVYAKNFSISEVGTYFDGATAAAGTKTYAWTGTADASTSTESNSSAPSTAASKVKVSANERDWMVV